MDKKRIILIGAIIIMMILVFTQVKKMGGANVSEPVEPQTIVEKVKYVGVLAAAEDIPLGARITDGNLSWIDWPAEAVNASLITEETNPDAKTELSNAIVRSPITQGEPINLGKLVKAGDSGVMAALLRPGMRAVTTRISVDTAAGGFIQPGDKVDVILREAFRVVNDEDADGSRNQGIVRERIYMANTLLENVNVLAIDQTFATSTEGEPYVIGSTATFELNQNDAEVLQEAEGMGDISLTLRGINRSNAYAPSASKAPRQEAEPAPSSLTIYRSGQAQRVAIQEQ